MEFKYTKNPIIQNKYSMKENNPAGDFFEELSEQDLNLVSGGTFIEYSRAIAIVQGLKGNYGQFCTISAECAGTHSCE
ncbi:plantaricin C family lantibiotic [Niallia sp. BSM11]|uniref:plantaricin C family lantibiotic n=1 Tax=Niallia sp. BSM11 TaxID=3391576 RepID=UPI00398540B4